MGAHTLFCITSHGFLICNAGGLKVNLRFLCVCKLYVMVCVFSRCKNKQDDAFDNEDEDDDEDEDEDDVDADVRV